MQHSKPPFPFWMKSSIFLSDMMDEMDRWGCGTQLEAGIWLGAQRGLGLPFSQSLLGGSDAISAWMEGGEKNPKIGFYRGNLHTTPPTGVRVFFISRFESAFLWKWVSLPPFHRWGMWTTYPGLVPEVPTAFMANTQKWSISPKLGKLHLPRFASFLCFLLLVTVHRAGLHSNLKNPHLFQIFPSHLGCPVLLWFGQPWGDIYSCISPEDWLRLAAWALRRWDAYPVTPWRGEESLLREAGYVNPLVDDTPAAFSATLFLS